MGMALVKCEECGQTVSDKASVCPHCGAPAGNNAVVGSFFGHLFALGVAGLLSWFVLAGLDPSGTWEMIGATIVCGILFFFTYRQIRDW